MYLRQIVFIENHCQPGITTWTALLYISTDRKVKEYRDYRVNTVHSNYFLPVGKADKNNSINWNLADVHVILVDEVRFSFVSRIYSPIKKPF